MIPDAKKVSLGLCAVHFIVLYLSHRAALDDSGG